MGQKLPVHDSVKTPLVAALRNAYSGDVALERNKITRLEFTEVP
jgi:hypothetical protein